MSSHLALPRRGNLEQVLHMFGYLKKNQNDEMVFDTSEPYAAHEEFKSEDQYSIMYGDIGEEQPPNVPETRGLGLMTRVYVDINHAVDQVT